MDLNSSFSCMLCLLMISSNLLLVMSIELQREYDGNSRLQDRGILNRHRAVHTFKPRNLGASQIRGKANKNLSKFKIWYLLRVHRLVFRRAQVGKQSCHLVKRASSYSLLVPAAREIVTDTLLVWPQQTVQRQDVAVADERHRVARLVNSLAVRSDLEKESNRNTILFKFIKICEN